MQVEVLRSWVSDLVGQNALLAKAVEELETAATGKLLAERARHAEVKRPDVLLSIYLYSASV